MNTELLILLVEDSPTDVMLTTEALAGTNFRLRTCERLADALKLLQETHFDVVLLDLGLPDSQGLVTLQKLRARHIHVPVVVVLTGRDDEQLALQAVKEGAQDYLVKSELQGGALKRAIRYAVERAGSATMLRQSEERYRTLIDATTSIVWNTPSSGEFETEQPSWAAFTGQTFDQLRGWGWLDAVHPEDRQNTARVWSEASASKNIYRVEHRLRRADGVYRDMSVRGVPILELGGGDREWVGVHVDVTDRKRTETERDDVLAKLTTQIERLPLAYMLTDAEFRCIRWNPVAERIFGFTETEMLGKVPWKVIVPAEHEESVVAIFLRLQAGDMNAHSTNENTTRDGRRIFCEWSNTPLFNPDGSFQGIIAIAQDITARRQVEETLQLRDRAIQAVTQGIIITDPNQPDNPIIYVSGGSEKITGYRSDEVLGRNCRLLQGKETSPEAIGQLRQAVRAGLPCTVELLNYRKDGTAFWNEMSISPVRDTTGRLTHFVGVQGDVSARRKLEEQFRQSQKMDAFGQLAGGVAHDFNNLLTIINGYSEMLLMSLPAKDPSRSFITEIHSAGERSAGLTRQLLAFSRQQVLTPSILNLNEIVSETEKMLRRLIGADIRLVCTLAESLWHVRADSGQIEQILLNLVVNSRDAMPQGGSITIETTNLRLDESYGKSHIEVIPGSYVMLSVSDTGCGMTSEVKARIFEPFYTTKEAGRGTGLGLATVYGIVKQSGGHVAVYSEVGIGTTFKVFLPMVEHESGGSKSHYGLQTPPMGTETILLAEDEAGVRALTRLLLAGCGYNVLEAANGEEAIRVATEHVGPIHLLVTDVVMPGLGGRAVAEKVAARYPGLKVLFISGYTDDAIIRHGVLREGVNFLQKPFASVALALKVREVLDSATSFSSP